MKRLREHWEPWLGGVFLLLLVCVALALGGEGLLTTIWTLLWLSLGVLLAIGFVFTVGCLFLILHGGIPLPKQDPERDAREEYDRTGNRPRHGTELPSDLEPKAEH